MARDWLCLCVDGVLCTLLSVVTWPLPHLGAVAPPLGLIALYYWTSHRPDLFRPGMAFLIGLLSDVINFLPLGLSALLFVAAHQMIFHQRRFFAGHSFFMMWSGFILTVLAVMLSEWLGPVHHPLADAAVLAGADADACWRLSCSRCPAGFSSGCSA